MYYCICIYMYYFKTAHKAYKPHKMSKGLIQPYQAFARLNNRHYKSYWRPFKTAHKAYKPHKMSKDLIQPYQAFAKLNIGHYKSFWRPYV